MTSVLLLLSACGGDDSGTGDGDTEQASSSMTDGGDDGGDDGGTASPGLTGGGKADGDDDGNDDGDDDGDDDGGSGCDVAQFQPAVIAFCEAQEEGSQVPAGSDLGSSCSTSSDCDGTCVEEFSGFKYCATSCDSNDDCPFGYDCDSISTGALVCLDRDCFVPKLVEDCVSEFLTRAENTCQAGCGTEFESWFSCFSQAAPVCFEGEAEGCGAELGVLNFCYE